MSNLGWRRHRFTDMSNWGLSAECHVPMILNCMLGTRTPKVGLCQGDCSLAWYGHFGAAGSCTLPNT